jgi:hypothetical protein
MAYLDSTIDAVTSDPTAELGVPQAAVEVEKAAFELPARSSAGRVPPPAVWKVYAVLALAVGVFLIAVLLMATGVVDALHT